MTGFNFFQDEQQQARNVNVKSSDTSLERSVQKKNIVSYTVVEA